MTVNEPGTGQTIVNFTPGPWKLCAHLSSPEGDKNCSCGYRGGIWSGDGEAIVCEMGGTPHADGIKFLPEVERPQQLADARLIAAAPTMFTYVAERADAGDAKAKEILEAINAGR